MDHIYMETGFDTGQDLLDRLHRLRALLARAGPRRVCALVVDSIAHLFRDVGDDAGVDEFSGRTSLLFKISNLLRCGSLSLP